MAQNSHKPDSFNFLKTLNFTVFQFDQGEKGNYDSTILVSVMIVRLHSVLNRKTKFRLYRTLVKPVLTYNSAVRHESCVK